MIYSDQPPPGNVKVETLNAPPPPANPNAVKDLAAKDAEIRKAKQARADEEAKAAGIEMPVTAGEETVESKPLVPVAVADTQCRTAVGAGVAVLDFESDRSDGENPHGRAL